MLGDNILVLAECWMSDGTPNKYNYRHECAKLMEKHASHEPWFGLEQEYTLLDLNNRPYGWPNNGFPAPQGPYYCGVGAGKVVQRDIVLAHYKACLVRISRARCHRTLESREAPQSPVTRFFPRKHEDND